jgi:hypothetical protein
MWLAMFDFLGSVCYLGYLLSTAALVGPGGGSPWLLSSAARVGPGNGSRCGASVLESGWTMVVAAVRGKRAR